MTTTQMEREMEEDRVQVRITESMARAFQRHAKYPDGYGIGRIIFLAFLAYQNTQSSIDPDAKIAAAELLLTPADAGATLKALETAVAALHDDLRALQALRIALVASLADDEEVEGTERS